LVLQVHVLAVHPYQTLPFQRVQPDVIVLPAILGMELNVYAILLMEPLFPLWESVSIVTQYLALCQLWLQGELVVLAFKDLYGIPPFSNAFAILTKTFG
jgi:hypothetical protein